MRAVIFVDFLDFRFLLGYHARTGKWTKEVTMKDRTILHLDIDAFFASVEQLLDPALRNRPDVVGGFANESGVVGSCSYEARAFGIHAGMALKEARRCCPRAVFVRGDFRHYERIQKQIRELLVAYSPSVEFSSIDDAYLDLTGLDDFQGPPLKTAARIRRAILERTGLSVSMGLGTSKVVARIASGCAKPAGTLVVLAGYERLFFREIDVKQIPGVGPLTGRILAELDVRTVGQLASVKRSVVEALFGRRGRKISQLANAVDPREVDERAVPLSISRETTFRRVTRSKREVESMLHYLTERATADLRKRKLLAIAVEVKLIDAGFRRSTRRRSMKSGPTDRCRLIYPMALHILRELLQRQVGVRLVGVSLAPRKRSTRFQHQLPLGTKREPLPRDALEEGIDRIRKKFGFGALLAGRSIDMLGKVERTERGFTLRTPSLNR